MSHSADDDSGTSCGCCQGIEPLTPQPVANRPGLPALRYRTGTHATFLATMLARLSSLCLGSPEECRQGRGRYPLRGLTARQPDDPAIALLDAWATVGDVLTFYQERLANEGFLRTAAERRSVLELARLVGYRLRPGVAASVLLAYEMEPGEKSVIPQGSQAQSVPGPGEAAQTFETGEPLLAWFRWNNLKPRQARPAYLSEAEAESIPSIYLAGLISNLTANTPVLFVFQDAAGGRITRVRRLQAAETQFAEQRTLLTLQSAVKVGGKVEHFDLDRGLQQLTRPPAPVPAGRQQMQRDLANNLAAASQAALRLMASGDPRLQRVLSQALSHATVTPRPRLQSLHLLRAEARPFGANAPAMSILDDRGLKIGETEWPLDGEALVRFNMVEVGVKTAQIRLARKNKEEIFRLSAEDLRHGQELESPRLELRLAAKTNDAGDEIELRLFFLDGEQIQTLKIRLEQDDGGLIVATNDEKRLVPSGQVVQYSTDTYSAVLAWQANNGGIEAAGRSSLIYRVPLPLPKPERHRLLLDMVYPLITPGSWVVVERPSRDDAGDKNLIVTRVRSVGQVGANAFGLSGNTTQLILEDEWLSPADRWLTAVRQTTVHVQSEAHPLGDQPIDPIQEAVAGDWIELDGWYSDLEAGRWVIVSGERMDVPGTTGVQAGEAALLAEVRQGVSAVSQDGVHADRPPVSLEASQSPAEDGALPGDSPHTFIRLMTPLAYGYKRDTVTIYGNVVRASHGETRNEVLGSGDATRPMQQFSLRQPPLTFVAAPTPSGTASTLEVYVNDVRWREADSLLDLAPGDRAYVSQIDDEGATSVLFGDGQQGARPPTGVQNITALYRGGIGKAGNVRAGQITSMLTRPLHAKAALNPLPATGGADRESRDQARRNVPLAVTALDRLVSVQDYADLASTFAGIGKAHAARLPDGYRQVVHVTIAGLDDVAIDRHSDLVRNLLAALHRYGEPQQPVVVDVRELLRLVLEARIRILADYRWETVKPRIEAALLDTFSFERRELGQDATVSEVIGVIQHVPGVAYVDVEKFGAIPEKVFGPDGESRPLTPTEIAAVLHDIPARPYDHPRVEARPARFEDQALRPAQIAYLTPEVPETLILNLREA